MKSIRFLLLTAIVLFAQIGLFAENVSLEKARQVGKAFMMQQKAYTSIELTQITDRSVDNQHFYVFNINKNQGWVIVADDDLSSPILGYSTSGNFIMENLPANINEWLVGISSEIQYIIDNKLVTEENKSQWAELSSGTTPEFSNKSEKSVSPLIHTKWDQSPYYNNLCPYDNQYGQRTVTGCVATAMAQVVNYYKHPAVGTGSHSYTHSKYGSLYANFGATRYDWNNMPNALSASSSSTQKEAVATLMYHMGVSVEMEYGVGATGGSGAYVISNYSNGEHCAEYALKNYFGYKSTAHGEMKDDYSNSQWKSMVRAELDASRPLIYAGFGNGGHCFVCAGYDNNDKFYFNWGWSGQNDGYFSLSALNPGSGGAGGGSYSFTSNQQAIFGLEPDGQQPNPGTATSIQLASSINVDSQISSGSTISVSARIANNTSSNFSGYVGAAAFDADGNFVSFIQTISTSISVGNSTNYNFSTSHNSLFVPGHYQVEIFYKTSTEDWTIIDNGGYNNSASFEIIYSADLETHSNFAITTNNGHLVQGRVATVNVGIKNVSEETFNGQFRVLLETMNGVFVQEIGRKTATDMQQGYYYTNGANFTGNITAEPGSYHMVLEFMRNGSNSWQYVGATNYQNPITVVVESSSAYPDIYEDNNTTEHAFQLALNGWENHQTTVLTTGSNFHVGNDIDYYKIKLPTGYNYVITPRLHDELNSGNGQTYTADAMFYYSTDGLHYSEPINDVMIGAITFSGGDIYFAVAPYFSGMTGTYLLEIQIVGDGDIGVDEDYATDVTLYPNPVKDMLHIECEHLISYNLYSYNGRLVKSLQITENEVVIDFSDLNSGAYILKIKTEEGEFSRRIIKK